MKKTLKSTLALIVIIMLSILFQSSLLMCTMNSFVSDSIVIYQYYKHEQYIDPRSNESLDFRRNIYIAFNFNNLKYNIISSNITSPGVQIWALISKGNFKIDKYSINMIDESNKIIFNGFISKDIMYYVTGVKDLKNKMFHRIDHKNQFGAFPPYLFNFTTLGNKFEDNFEFVEKDKLTSNLLSGKYTNSEKNKYIEINNKEYYIYSFDRNKISFEISSGEWEINDGIISFKDDDEVNIIKAYLVDETIYPINHFPNTLKNEPLILEKK